MRISKRNLDDINKTVEGMILDWADKIEIWNIKPIEQQTTWNPLMKEIDGPVEYNKLFDVPVQFTDLTPLELKTDKSGDKFMGEIVLYVPFSYNYTSIDEFGVESITRLDIDIDEDSLFILQADGAKWRVKSIKSLPGERIVRVIKMLK